MCSPHTVWCSCHPGSGRRCCCDEDRCSSSRRSCRLTPARREYATIAATTPHLFLPAKYIYYFLLLLMLNISPYKCCQSIWGMRACSPLRRGRLYEQFILSIGKPASGVTVEKFVTVGFSRTEVGDGYFCGKTGYLHRLIVTPTIKIPRDNPTFTGKIVVGDGDDSIDTRRSGCD